MGFKKNLFILFAQAFLGTYCSHSYATAIVPHSCINGNVKGPHDFNRWEVCFDFDDDQIDSHILWFFPPSLFHSQSWKFLGASVQKALTKRGHHPIIATVDFFSDSKPLTEAYFFPDSPQAPGSGLTEIFLDQVLPQVETILLKMLRLPHFERRSFYGYSRGASNALRIVTQNALRQNPLPIDRLVMGAPAPILPLSLLEDCEFLDPSHPCSKTKLKKLSSWDRFGIKILFPEFLSTKESYKDHSTLALLERALKYGSGQYFPKTLVLIGSWDRTKNDGMRVIDPLKKILEDRLFYEFPKAIPHALGPFVFSKWIVEFLY